MGVRLWNRRRWMWLLIACLGWAAVGMWAGCRTPQEKYKALSFFFDGVPDPSAPPKAAGEQATVAGGKPTAVQAMVSTHKPYAEQKCNTCHTDVSVLIDASVMNASRCIPCHKSVPRQYPVMHGPVDAGACLWCHAPHESAQPALLREAAPKLCLQCHDPRQLPAQPPEHKTARQSCLDCHVAHGGAKHGLLRPQAAASPSTSREVR